MLTTGESEVGLGMAAALKAKEALRASTTWPNFKLSEVQPSTRVTSTGLPGDVSAGVLQDVDVERVENGQALLQIFSENIRNAAKKALNSFCTA